MSKTNNDQFFAKARPKSEAVESSYRDEPFIIRGLSAFQRLELFGVAFNEKGKPRKNVFFAGELVFRCAINSDGTREFTSEESRLEFYEMSEDAIGPLAEVAQRLSGLTPDADEDAVKN